MNKDTKYGIVNDQPIVQPEIGYVEYSDGKEISEKEYFALKEKYDAKQKEAFTIKEVIAVKK